MMRDKDPSQGIPSRKDMDGQGHSEPQHGSRRMGEQGPEQSGKHPPEALPERIEQQYGGDDFWLDWREERHHYRDGEKIQVGPVISPTEVEAWREFFRKTFGVWPEEHWIVGGRRFSPWHQGMDVYNPFVAHLLSKGGGLLPLYILYLISQHPRYGNELMELLTRRTNGQWVSNPGAIYPLLGQLEKEGFIEGKWEDPDKRTIRIYTITPAGLAEVSRIVMMVIPKLAETVEVLQEFINDLKPEKMNW